jgi:hypothetical protein
VGFDRFLRRRQQPGGVENEHQLQWNMDACRKHGVEKAEGGKLDAECIDA